MSLSGWLEDIVKNKYDPSTDPKQRYLDLEEHPLPPPEDQVEEDDYEPSGHGRRWDEKTRDHLQSEPTSTGTKANEEILWKTSSGHGRFWGQRSRRRQEDETTWRSSSTWWTPTWLWRPSAFWTPSTWWTTSTFRTASRFYSTLGWYCISSRWSSPTFRRSWRASSGNEEGSWRWRMATRGPSKQEKQSWISGILLHEGRESDQDETKERDSTARVGSKKQGELLESYAEGDPEQHHSGCLQDPDYGGVGTGETKVPK